MIYNLIKHFYKKNSFAKIAIFLSLFFLSFSCSDQGCIDADDFGEYESQTIEVKASNSQDQCSYDLSKELDDYDAQGTGVIPCFISGAKSVTDSNGTTQSVSASNNPAGCEGFTDASFRTICISQCVQDCLTSNSTTSTSSEPAWTSTTKRAVNVNSGVTISPGSEIIINAIGNISLGNAASYPDVYVQADRKKPHSKYSNWSDLFFDVNAGQYLDLKFSGSWSNGIKNFGTESAGLSTSGTAANDLKIYNGARRIAAFVIPHPIGYGLNSAQTDEKLAAKDVPLLPDPDLWTCSYAETNSFTDAVNCSAGDYPANGYSSVNNAATAAVFPISGSEETTTLGTHGGLIRWSRNGEYIDGIKPASYDPFSENSVSCDLTNTCTNFDTNVIIPTMGTIVGDTSASSVEIESPSSTDSYEVSFKNLSTQTSCSSIKISVKDESDNYLNNGGGSIGTTISISTSFWSPDLISLEPNQKLVITDTSGSGLNCGKGIAVKFSKYKDIEIEQSGFVSFKILDSSTSSTCAISGRIINPNGSHSDSSFDPDNGSVTGYSADFYEYDNFLASSSSDPLASLSVSKNWSNDVFVRKGQKIRLSPKSWNNTWSTSNGLTADCGIGMAMSISPRPALLCRGVANEYISNPSCTPEYDSTSGSPVLIGCQAVASECTNTTTNSSGDTVASSTSNYCPINNCQKSVTCTAGMSPNYQKSGCSLGSIIDATNCSYNESTTSGAIEPYYNSATCDNCSNLKATYAGYAAKIYLNDIDQCYDLENYTGKIANINSSTGFTEDDLANSKKSKGAKKIGTFNGSYGNFSNFYDTGEFDSHSSRIFQLTSSTSFPVQGRLRFFLLDGDDFNSNSASSTEGISDAYINNSASGGSYNKTNGVRVGSSGMLSFSNGQWMEIKLCKESSGSSVDCRSIAAPSGSAIDATELFTFNSGRKLSDQPHLIDITAPTTQAEALSLPNITSPYKFDASGNLYRTTANGTNDCSETIANSYFYCHTHEYISPTEFENKAKSTQSDIISSISKLRLTFKILDPEIGNCSISGTGSTLDGIKISNPYYDSTTTSNINATCTGSDSAPGSSGCQKQFYCADKYKNNSGSYFVNVKVKKPLTSNISSIVGEVINPIVEVMDGEFRNCTYYDAAGSSHNGVKTSNPNYTSTTSGGVCDDPSVQPNCTEEFYCKAVESSGQAEKIYKSLISDPRYKAIVNMCLVVMFTFYGLGFLMGVSELNHSEIINRIIKISIIYLFIGESGWYWFDTIVVKFFKNGTDYLAFMMASSFDSSANLSEAIANGDYYDKSVLFSSVDQVFNMIMSDAVQKKISALLFASIFGWLYMLIIYYSFLVYVYAIANAILLYLTAQVFISILFTLGPIFFIFTLFSQTKDMFDNWLKQLITFSLQQIFLLTTLAFFNMLMYEVIKLSLGYKICWAEVWSINIIVHISLMSSWTIASLPPRTNTQSSVGNIGNPEGIPSLFSILFIYVIASLMNKFVTFMTDVAASIGGGVKASSLGSGIKAEANKMLKKMDGYAKEAFKEFGGEHLIARMDDYLFDSGAVADKRRADMAKEDNKLSSDKDALGISLKSAIEEYKNKNGAELALKSHEEVAKILKEVGDNAIKETAKKRGLSEADTEKALNFKGSRNTYNNALAAAYYQVRNSRAKTLNETKTDTSLSDSQFKSALKDSDSETRNKMIQALKDGKIDVKSATISEKASYAKSGAAKIGYDSAKSLGKSAYNASVATYKLKTKEGRNDAIKAGGETLQKAKEATAKASSSAFGYVEEKAFEARSAARYAVNKLTAKDAKDAAKATPSAIYGGAKAAVKAIYHGGEAAGGAIYSAAAAVKDATTSTANQKPQKIDYKAAEEIAIATGKADAMLPGTKWTRPDSQKQNIKAIQAEMAKDRFSEISEPNADIIARFEGMKDDLDAKETPTDKKAKPTKKERKARAAAAAFEGKRAQVQKQLSATQEAEKENETEIEYLENNLRDIDEAIDNNPEQQAIAQATKARDGATNKKEKITAQKALNKLTQNKSSELKNLEKAKSQTTAKLKTVEVKKQNLGIKSKDLQSLAQSMDQAAEFKSRSDEKLARNDIEAPEISEAKEYPDNRNEFKDDSDDSDSSPKKQSPVQKKIAALGEKAGISKDSALQKSDEIKKTAAEKVALNPKNLATRFTASLDSRAAEVKAKKAEKEYQKETAKLTEIQSGDIGLKAESIVKSAQEVLEEPSAIKDSTEYRNAENVMQKFEAIDSAQDLEKFVKSEEEYKEKVAEDFGDLKTAEDFKEFNKKYTPSTKNPEDK